MNATVPTKSWSTSLPEQESTRSRRGLYFLPRKRRHRLCSPPVYLRKKSKLCVPMTLMSGTMKLSTILAHLTEEEPPGVCVKAVHVEGDEIEGVLGHAQLQTQPQVSHDPGTGGRRQCAGHVWRCQAQESHPQVDVVQEEPSQGAAQNRVELEACGGAHQPGEKQEQSKMEGGRKRHRPGDE